MRRRVRVRKVMIGGVLGFKWGLGGRKKGFVGRIYKRVGKIGVREV